MTTAAGRQFRAAQPPQARRRVAPYIARAVPRPRDPPRRGGAVVPTGWRRRGIAATSPGAAARFQLAAHCAAGAQTRPCVGCAPVICDSGRNPHSQTRPCAICALPASSPQVSPRAAKSAHARAICAFVSFPANARFNPAGGAMFHLTVRELCGVLSPTRRRRYGHDPSGHAPTAFAPRAGGAMVTIRPKATRPLPSPHAQAALCFSVDARCIDREAPPRGRRNDAYGCRLACGCSVIPLCKRRCGVFRRKCQRSSAADPRADAVPRRLWEPCGD